MSKGVWSERKEGREVWIFYKYTVFQEYQMFSLLLQYLSDGKNMFWGRLCAVNVPIKQQWLHFMLSEIMNHTFQIFTTDQTSRGLKQTYKL